MKTCLAIALSIIAFLIPDASLAQKKQGQALIDSLLTQLAKANNDTSKIRLLSDISYNYRNINTDEGIKYGNQGLILAENTHWKKGIANSNNSLGSNYTSKRDYPKAIEYYEKALSLYQELGIKLDAANMLNKIGYSYYYQNNYSTTLEYGYKALAINEALGNKSRQIQNLQLIAITYLDQAEYPLSIETSLKAIRLAEEIDDKRLLANNYNNSSIAYHRQGYYVKALEQLIKAVALYEELGDEDQIAATFSNIGNIYLKQEDYPKALDYFFKSLSINEKNKNQRGIAINLNNIGTTYYEQDKYPEDLEYFMKALAINEELGYKTQLVVNFINIGNIYQGQNNYAKALEYELKAVKISKELGYEDHEGAAMSSIGHNYLKMAKDSNALSLSPFSKGNKADYLQQAKLYTDSAIVLQQKVGELNDLFITYEQQSEINALLGDPINALISYKQYTSLKDSVFNLEKDKKITQTVLTYEFAKREDSLKLETEKREIGLQKEMALKSLSYEYEKKRQAAKTEEEKQKLVFEEKLKQQEIENTYAQKIAAAEALQKQTELEAQKKELERKQKEELAKTEQEKKDIQQRNIRNSILVGLGATLLFLVVVYRQRNKIAKEKHRSEELLLNILPAETAEELKATGTAQAKDFSEVTVLFTDFKNFTTMSEHLSAQELVNEINYYYSAFDNIISTHHIEKIKTIGDAYMCAGGLPTANKTHAVDTVSAALAIRDFMNAERKKRQAQGKPFLEIRIGCNTGPVIAGIVGIKKFAYDIWGDTVNTASRIESSGEVGKVNISGSTYELVKDKFTCIHRGKIQAKNKGEIDMYFVEA